MLRSNTDYERKRVLIPDMKHPTKKKGNDIWVLIPDEAWDIMLSMPVNDDKPDEWCIPVLVTDIKPTGTNKVKVTAFEYSDDVYLYDDALPG